MRRIDATPASPSARANHAVGRHHELFDERSGAVLFLAHDIDGLTGLHHGVRLNGFEIERAVLEARARHAPRRLVLELELRGKLGAGGNFGRLAVAFKPSAHAVVGQLRLVAHQRAVRLAVRRRARLVHAELDGERGAVLVLVERGNALGELRGEHGKDFDAGVDRARLALRMAVDHAAFADAGVDVGHAHEHANAVVGEPLGPLDLV